MTEQETINIVIAEFMGCDQLQSPYKGAITPNHTKCNSEFASFIHDLMEDESWYVYPKFTSSWDWFHPVWNKLLFDTTNNFPLDDAKKFNIILLEYSKFIFEGLDIIVNLLVFIKFSSLFIG